MDEKLEKQLTKVLTNNDIIFSNQLHKNSEETCMSVIGKNRAN